MLNFLRKFRRKELDLEFQSDIASFSPVRDYLWIKPKHLLKSCLWVRYMAFNSITLCTYGTLKFDFAISTKIKSLTGLQPN